jgi:flagellar biosynthetic protein FlhB
MAEDSDAEKTESASPKRLEQAREEGDVPRSREVATFTVLMAAGCCLWFAGEGLARRLMAIMVSGVSMDRTQIFDPDVMIHRVANDIGSVLLSCLPLGLVVMGVALASPVLVGGWLFSGKAVAPNFGKLNPARGLGNMFSTNALVELLKAVAKATLVGIVAWMVMRHQQDAVMALASESLRAGSSHLISLLLTAFMIIVGALGLIAAIDGPYQIWHYANKLKMTRQETIQENKEANGNPQIKAKIRQLQREMSRRRMMAAVPTADVVVTNPTHYAVALASWPRAAMKWRRRSAKSRSKTMWRSWKRRRWRARCTSTRTSTTKFPRRCMRLWPKCWPMSSSCARMAGTAATVPTGRKNCRCRPSSIRSIPHRKRHRRHRHRPSEVPNNSSLHSVTDQEVTP